MTGTPLPAVRRDFQRSSRECMQTAADVAAFFSDARHIPGGVDVMYTDSRHVAKRGSRVGQMKQSKRLGVLLANPDDVSELVREVQQSQVWR